MSSICLIVSGGGHDAVLLDALLLSDSKRRYVVLDADPSRWGTEVMGVLVAGGDDLLPKLVEEGAKDFVVAVGGARAAGNRATLFDRLISFGLAPLTVFHPRSVCAESAEIGAGSQLLAGAIVNPRARLGRNVIVNTGAIVEHDCQLGDHVHIATGAKLAGQVIVEKGAHVGIGASIREGIVIGEQATVGAGAVVVRNVPRQCVVVGNPATPLVR